MRDLLCAFAAVCALCFPLSAAAQPVSSSPRGPSHRAPRLSRSDRSELRRSLAMLTPGPSSPALPAMRSFIVPNLPPPESPAQGASPSPGRIDAALRALDRSGLIRRCWQQHLLRHPSDPGRSAQVSLRVAPDGQWSSVSLAVESAPALAACVSFGLRTLNPLPPGEPVDASAPVSLDPGSR